MCSTHMYSVVSVVKCSECSVVSVIEALRSTGILPYLPVVSRGKDEEACWDAAATLCASVRAALRVGQFVFNNTQVWRFIVG